METKLKYVIGLGLWTGLVFSLLDWNFGPEVLMISFLIGTIYSIYRLIKGNRLKYCLGWIVMTGVLFTVLEWDFWGEMLLVSWVSGSLYFIYRIIKG